jgi:hypothetical protein
MESSLVTVSKELSKYKLDLVGIRDSRWDKGSAEPASECAFFNGKRE